MITKLYASVAAVALTASAATAAGHLAFTPGEGDFSWDAYNEWAANAPDLAGQSVTVFGPWLSP
ncbi:alpha-glucoside ABC transporter substrate-binding protein, partial [Halomonas litopenaei]|nr:alpha-glucoside ABC transporter substrate-binding protein [Halomonas litopenaei]